MAAYGPLTEFSVSNAGLKVGVAYSSLHACAHLNVSSLLWCLGSKLRFFSREIYAGQIELYHYKSFSHLLCLFCFALD